MKKDRSAEDIISEEDYTLEMQSASSLPEADSPGDSEADSGAEFKMGLDYLPNEENDPEEADEEIQDLKNENERPVVKIPETAKVIFSDAPSHWMDRDAPSDTH